jgi:hypothetical protein
MRTRIWTMAAVAVTGITVGTASGQDRLLEASTTSVPAANGDALELTTGIVRVP